MTRATSAPARRGAESGALHESGPRHASAQPWKRRPGAPGAFLEFIGQGYDDSWLAGREAMVRGAADRLGLDMAC